MRRGCGFVRQVWSVDEGVQFHFGGGSGSRGSQGIRRSVREVRSHIGPRLHIYCTQQRAEVDPGRRQEFVHW
jgi:hypothetical protein